MRCECKCRFYGKKCNSGQWWNNDKCLCDCKKRHLCKNGYVWNPATCSCQNGKHLVSIMYSSAITSDEIIDAEAKSNDEKTKTFTTNFSETNTTYKTQKFDNLLTFLLIIIALLIAVSIDCYLIKYQEITNSENLCTNLSIYNIN